MPNKRLEAKAEMALNGIGENEESIGNIGKGYRSHESRLSHLAGLAIYYSIVAQLQIPFDQIIAEIRAITPRAEILVEEVPAPQKLAPFSIALTADVLEDAATGRFVLLHDPKGQEGWSGEYRCVTFVRAAIDLSMAADPMLSDVGWSWLVEALKKYDCQYEAPSGTVTRVASVSYGMLEGREDDSEMEVRASWTPTSGSGIANHVRAWLDLLGLSAALEPIPDGVTQLSPHRK